jgi:hypothetical protein
MERWAMADRKEISSILATVYGNTDADIKDLAANVIDHLTKLGFESYRSILQNPTPAPAIETPNSVRV